MESRAVVSCEHSRASVYVFGSERERLMLRRAEAVRGWRYDERSDQLEHRRRRMNTHSHVERASKDQWR